MISICDLLADPTSAVEAKLACGIRLVTFDVFDTLLWRTTLFPHDAFLALGANPGPATAAARRIAERIASRFCRTILRREPTLSDIYRLLPFSMQHELALEATVCEPNPFCLRLVRSLCARKVQVAAISDMYLSSNQIEALLQMTGFPKIPTYSSATEMATKYSDGKLFVKVWERHQVVPGETLHVGDNPHADVAMAARHGGHACRVGTPRSLLFALHPSLNRPMKRLEDSIYWGTLALRANGLLPLNTEPRLFAEMLRPPLADIVSAAEGGAPLELESAWAHLAAGFPVSTAALNETLWCQ